MLAPCLPLPGSADGRFALAEISHTIARHSAEKASGYKVLMAFALVAELCGLDIGISRAAATLLLSLPNSRKMETEADHMGAWCLCLSCAPYSCCRRLGAHVQGMFRPARSTACESPRRLRRVTPADIDSRSSGPSS